MRRYPYLALTLVLFSGYALTDEPTEAASPEPAEVQTPVPAAPVLPRPAVFERSTQHALTQALPRATEQLTLSTPQGEFLALWQRAHTAQPQGVVILLPGQYQHVDQPGMIQPLRTHLPKYGWHTLSISLPEPYNAIPVRQAMPVLLKSPPSTEDTGIASPETKSEPAVEPIEQALAEDEPTQEPDSPPHVPSQPQTDPRLEYAESVFDRLDAALAFVKPHSPNQLVLIGNDTGAYWSARYIQSRTPADVTQLIWINAANAQAMTPTLDALLGELNKPVVDLYTRQPLNQAQSALVRKEQGLQLGLTDYRSVGVAALPNPAASQEQLVKRVRAALTP